ncbi:hypothetical protein [Bradyrhizobium sp. USDA 4451]
MLIEPSARLYTLWEPPATTDAAVVTPYLGVYSDYYFSRDDAPALAVNGIPVNPTLVLEGWSARVTGGLNARVAGGVMLGLGAEYGGLGGTAQTWTFSARARVPFN